MSVISLSAVHYSQSTSIQTPKLLKGPNSNTSESTGTIVKVIIEATELDGRHVQASKDNPRYEVGTCEF
jgi:hypothetical protein